MMRLRGMEPSTFGRAVMAGIRSVPRPTHLFLCIADHFEPEWRQASPTKQIERVDRWVDNYARSVAPFSDSCGRPPQHTFFYPIECYQADLLDRLSKIVRSGYGDIEVHLHHDNDNGERLREFLGESIELLHHRHGLLSKDSTGKIRYGFVHGNWALDNSHPDGRWCGVNDELTILRETGCYADFTMPAAPHAAQTRTINSIYYAIDDPDKPQSHNTGFVASVGAAPPEDSLLMIQGPLCISQTRLWTKPCLENGNVTGTQLPTVGRLKNWLRASVSVQGQEDWLFVKLHTHGAQEANADILLGQPMREFHAGLGEYASQQGIKFYYVTAREMALLVKQAEAGLAQPNMEKLSWEHQPLTAFIRTGSSSGHVK